jgi:hypothetical protein
MMDEILETRKNQFKSFVANIYELQASLESSKADESTELARRLAIADIADEHKIEEDEEEVEMIDQDL